MCSFQSKPIQNNTVEAQSFDINIMTNMFKPNESTFT